MRVDEKGCCNICGSNRKDRFYICWDCYCNWTDRRASFGSLQIGNKEEIVEKSN